MPALPGEPLVPSQLLGTLIYVGVPLAMPLPFPSMLLKPFLGLESSHGFFILFHCPLCIHSFPCGADDGEGRGCLWGWERHQMSGLGIEIMPWELHG